MKTQIEIKDSVYGRIEIDYEGIGLSDDEKVVIYINGIAKGTLCSLIFLDEITKNSINS